MREVLKGQDLSFTETAKIVGERWQVLAADVREQYEKQAATAKEKYHAELLEYKKTDNWASYNDYLVDFRARTSQLGSGNELQAKGVANCLWLTAE